MTRVAAVFLVAGFMLSVTAIVPSAAPAAIETSNSGDMAPWWPLNVTQADQFREGWNLRIPLAVQHERGRDLRAGAPVQVHLDLAGSMLEGGWPKSGNKPLSFISYPESVRLIEYTEGWQQVRSDTQSDGIPVRRFTTWLEPDQSESQYKREQTGPFHGQRNAVVTLEWRLARDLPAGEAQFYFVYFDIRQNAGENQEFAKTEASFDAVSVERLDSLYWVGSGTTIYGYTDEATTKDTLLAIATEDDTEVSVYTYRGRSVAVLDKPAGDKENPFTINAAQQAAAYSFGLQSTHFRIEADKPIIVMTHDTSNTGIPEFVPSREGGLLGWQFSVPGVAQGVYVIKPPSETAATIEITGASSQPTQCHILHTSQVRSCQIRFNGQDPTGLRNIEVVNEGGSPVLVQFIPQKGGHHAAQAASALGSPVGAVFHAGTLGEQCAISGAPAGGFQVAAWGRGAFVDVPGTSHSSVEVEPPPRDTIYDRFQGGDMNVQFCPPNKPPLPQWNTPFAYTAQAVPVPETGEPSGPIQLRAGEFQGLGLSQTTPLGGRHGMEFQAKGPLVVYNYYPATDIEVTRHDGSVEEHTLGPLGAPREFGDVTILRSEKPVSVFPMDASSGFARFHAAKPDFIVPDILPGQYRGYLFDVAPQGGVDPVFATGLPGQSLENPFQVSNLARWDGQPLRDTVRFSATVESRNWNGAASVGVGFDQREMVLQDAAPRNNRLTIDLPPDVPSDTQITVRVTAVSEGNPQMTQSFSVVVLVKQTYGVSMWFEGQAEQEASKSLRIVEGAEEPIGFFVRNDGSGVDDFHIALGAPGGGWDAHITDLAGLPLTRIDGLEPNDQVGAILHVRAPLTVEAGVEIPIDAVSVTSPLASKRISVDAGIALEVGMRLEAESFTKEIAPGTTESFLVTLVNTGEDMVTVCPMLEAELPQDWSLGFANDLCTDDTPIGVHPCNENDPPQKCRLPMEIELSAPEDAVADEFVSFLLRAEALGEGINARGVMSLSATVATSHDLTITPLAGPDVAPGIPTELEVTVHNDGNGADTVHIGPATVPGGWIVPPTENDRIEPGESATFTVQVEAPQDALPGAVDLVLAAHSGGPAFPFVVTANVQETHDIAWRQHAEVITQPGDTQEVVLFIENLGNTPERVSLQVSAPWPVQLDAEQVDVPAGGVRAIGISWDTGDVEGADEILVTARAESGPREILTIPVRVVAPRLDADEIVQTTAPRGPGDVGTILAVMRNPGEAPVRDAEVRLVSGQALLGAVAFQSIGPNGTVVAPLRWTEDPAATPDRIEWGHWRAGEFHVLGTAPVPKHIAAADDRNVPLTPLGPLVALLAIVARRRGGAP